MGDMTGSYGYCDTLCHDTRDNRKILGLLQIKKKIRINKSIIKQKFVNIYFQTQSHCLALSLFRNLISQHARHVSSKSLEIS